MKLKKKKVLKPITLLSLGYFFTILIGTVLLMLPEASATGERASLLDSLFTATSATCVTGLTVNTTALHWSMFGQIVIICLIQIGGLGFMTLITLLFMIFGKKIGIYNRTVLMQSAGSYNISEVTVLIKRIILGTLLFEGLGALILSLEFSKTMEMSQAIYYGVFHSISAFCNAGFDIVSLTGNSLVQYSGNYVVLITIMALIIIGGTGFIVWSDMLDSKFKFNKFQLHTKLVLVFNTLIFVLGAALFYVFEFSSLSQSTVNYDFSFSEQILNSFFLSVSPRTAGFNAVDLKNLTSSSKLLSIVLMVIGGNSGSTAGGLKVTTLVIIVANLISSARGNDKVVLYNRKVDDKVIKQSGALFISYLAIIVCATMLITAFEQFAFEDVLFEVTSAIATVGCTMGLSAGCASPVTKVILIILMYAGRLGALALFSLFVKRKNEYILEEPKGKILVG